MIAPAPLVSVVLTTHNFDRYIDAALDAVLAQTLSDFELIVVDDGSHDGTRDCVRARGDGRIELVEVSGYGAPRSANEGLRHARGTYVAVWDGDDLWRPGMLARHVETLEAHPEAPFSFCWCGLIDDSAAELGGGFARLRGLATFEDLLEDFTVGTNSAVVFRSASLRAVGGFNANLSHAYDLNACLRLAAAAAAIPVVEEELALYRRHSKQMSRDYRPLQKDWEATLEELRELAPERVWGSEPRARSNMSRYFSYVCYEARDLRTALALLAASFARSPFPFLSDIRNTQLVAACAARALGPAAWVDTLERRLIRRWRGGTR